MLQNWKKNMVVRSEETNENDFIVIRDSDSDTDIEIEFERVVESNDHLIGFEYGVSIAGF